MILYCASRGSTIVSAPGACAATVLAGCAVESWGAATCIEILLKDSLVLAADSGVSPVLEKACPRRKTRLPHRNPRANTPTSGLLLEMLQCRKNHKI
jgi:hypothetical protein